MDFEPLSNRIGARVAGLDITQPYGPDVGAALRQAMRVHKLLVIDADELQVEDQVRLLQLFGNVWDERGDDSRHIFVSNAKEGAVLGRPDGLLYHSDCLFMSAPLAVISLYAMELPLSPTPTVFANAVSVVDDLPEGTRQRLDDARGVFVGGLGGYERLRSDSAPAGALRAEHPIRYEDVLAGQRSLLVDELYFDHFVDWDLDDSDAIRNEIHRYLFADGNTYAHQWKLNELVVWDNIALQHGRPAVPSDGSRTLRRVVALESSVNEYDHLTEKALEIESQRG
jgi:taurine dioxygenase